MKPFMCFVPKEMLRHSLGGRKPRWETDAAKRTFRSQEIRIPTCKKLKKRLDEMTGSKGEQAVDNGNQQYIYYFDGHGTMLVQDNHMPSVILYIQYYNQDKATE